MGRKGGVEWEETRLVVLGELFGANAFGWLTEGTRKGRGITAQGTENSHRSRSLWRSRSDGCDLDCALLQTRVKPIFKWLGDYNPLH